MKGLHSFMPLLLWPTVHAVTVTRICQSTGDYAPSLRDCQGYKDAINKQYADGMIVQTNIYASCQVVYQYQTCNIDVCAFPDQGLNTSSLFATVDDLLSNCQNALPAGTLTGGYNIIDGTNVTVGVLGTKTPYQTKVTSTNSSSPLSTDCQAAHNSISLNQNYTQNDSSNCTVVARSGSCQFSYCDIKGSQMSGVELQRYAGNLYLLAAQGPGPLHSSGFIQISQDKRVAVFSTRAPTSVAQHEVHCRSYYDGSPKGRDCDAAFAALNKANPFGYVQTQANAECVTIATSGACQIDLCGPTNDQLATGIMKQVLSQINSTCQDSTGAIGGYARVAGSNMTLSVSTTNIPKNVWCNTSPNNSPEYSECGDVIDAIQPNQAYQQVSPIGCTLLEGNGKCKLNYCAPQGDIISGRDLKAAAIVIFGTCFSGNYVSGIYQINQNTSVAIYDPPTKLTSDGDPVCETSSNSPLYKDCVAAIGQLQTTNPDNDCTNLQKKGPKSCTSVATVGTCQIQVCGLKTEPFKCGTIGAYANWITRNCTDGSLIGGGLGLRNAYYGDAQIQVINSGQSSKREAPESPFHSGRFVRALEPKASTTKSAAISARTPNLPNIQGTNLYVKLVQPAFYVGVAAAAVTAQVKSSLTQRVRNGLRRGAATMSAATPLVGMSENWKFFASKNGPYNEQLDLSQKLEQGNAAGGSSTFTAAPDLLSAICSYMQNQANNVFQPNTPEFGMYTDRYDVMIVDAYEVPVCDANLGCGF